MVDFESLFEVLSLITDSLPAKKQAPIRAKLEALRSSQTVYGAPGWSPERRAQMANAISNYWDQRRKNQPFKVVWRDGVTQTVNSYARLAEYTQLAESTLRQRFSKGGGSFIYYDRDARMTCTVTRLPYDDEHVGPEK